MWTYLLPAVLVHGTELLLVRWVLTQTDRSPAASVAWILAIVFVPFLGPLAFLVFGMTRVDSRRRKRIDADREMRRLLGGTAESHVVDPEAFERPCRQLARLAEGLTGNGVTAGNRVEIISDTNRTLGLIHQAVEAAEDTLNLEYYIWEPDQTGRRLRDALIHRAGDGLRIRFLYDAFGSMLLRRRFLAPMREAGIEVAAFSPGNSFRDRWSINLRSHRKIVVADGRVGFTGGMNIGDEYHGKRKKFGFWRDTHAKLEGPAVAQLQRVFADDWFYSTGQRLEDPDEVPPLAGGPSLTQVIAGGPTREPRPFHTLMFTAVAEARDEVLLTTSYFIPTEPLAMVLCAAALRGVRVRVLVPGRTAHLYPVTIWAGRSYYRQLLASGVEIYEYDRGILHAKTLVVDGQWSLVGTPNYDNRSVSLNFEVAAAFFEPDEAAVLRQQFEADVLDSTPVTAESREDVRPLMRAAENFTRLFAPVM